MPSLTWRHYRKFWSVQTETDYDVCPLTLLALSYLAKATRYTHVLCIYVIFVEMLLFFLPSLPCYCTEHTLRDSRLLV